MPITLTCPECDQSLKFQDDVAFGAIHCPRCGAKVYLGDPDEVDRLEEEEEDRKERRIKKGKKKKRERIEGLATVSRGLGIHYAGILVFVAALWAYWLAFAVMLACLFTGMPDLYALTFLRDMFLVAVLISGVATVLEIPAGILCLFVPDGGSKALALTSLVLRLGMILLGVWFTVAEDKVAPVILNGLLLVVAFFFWMFFLRRLANFLKQDGLAQEVFYIILRALFTALALFTFLFCVSLFIRLLMVVETPVARAVVVTSFAGPLATLIGACFKLSGGDSVLMIVLYPTGIPFVLCYLELISSTRLALMRRA